MDLCGNIRLTSDAGDVTIAIPRCLGNVGFSGLVRAQPRCDVMWCCLGIAFRIRIDFVHHQLHVNFMTI